MATEELNKVVSTFLSNDIAKPYVPSGVSPVEFSQLAFVEPKTLAKAFCGDINLGRRPTFLAAQQNILKKAHQTLRRLYDDQMENIEKLMSKMIKLKNMGFSRGIELRLADVFVADPTGAEMVLDKFAQEGRQLLASHYLNVETVYKNAIKEFAQISRGELPKTGVNPPIPVAPRPSGSNLAPKNVYEKGDQELHSTAYKNE